jgi:hypothetical protein
MAVEAVLSEPLSRPDSLVSGINTGIFSWASQRMPWHCPVNPHESRRFLAPSSRLGPRLNREFNFNYQGIVIAYLGKLRPISELRNYKPDVLARPRKSSARPSFEGFEVLG